MAGDDNKPNSDVINTEDFIDAEIIKPAVRIRIPED